MMSLIATAWLFFFIWLRSYRRALAIIARARMSEVSTRGLAPEDEARAGDATPCVSVLVAARNEESNLDACLWSLRAQDYPRLEIIVVDDRSTDRTREILARHAAEDDRIIAIAGVEPPPGWFGKPNALRLAARSASGEWLLTTDADTIHAPSSVRAGVAHALSEGLDALSLIPKLEYRSLTAHLLYPQLTAFFGATVLRDRDGTGMEPIGASGGWFLIRRDCWDAIGGMAGVKAAIAEDFELAKAVVASGGRFRYSAGPSLWSTPSYSTMREFYEGYARNPSLALGRFGRVLLVVLATWVGALLPLVTAVLCARALLVGSNPEVPRWALELGLVPYAAILALQASLRSRLRTHPWMSLFAPIGALVGGLMLLALFFRQRAGRTLTWKGRSYAAARRA